MFKVKYGDKIIEYTFVENEALKSHYITVVKGSGVVLKGKRISEAEADKLILKKARWILDKLDLVSAIADDDIVTGSRMAYLGRKYYVQLYVNEGTKRVIIDFTDSQFKVSVPSADYTQGQLRQAFEYFYRYKAIEKMTARAEQWSAKTGLVYKELRFRKLHKQWGSCSPNNVILLNSDAIKLPYTLIDYLIVHELVHTVVKNHSKEFWAEVSKYIPNWKELDAKMYGMKL